MECPYCGFYHLSPQERCARCKKPLQPENSEKESADTATAGDEGVPAGPDEAREKEFRKELRGDNYEADEEAQVDEFFAAGSSEEESEDDWEDETVPPEDAALADDKADDEREAAEHGEEDDYFVAGAAEGEEVFEAEKDGEDSREIEDYPEAASVEYAPEVPRDESTGELVNRALREIDVDLRRISRRNDSEPEDGQDSAAISDGPILATLLSESDEQELTGSMTEEDYTEPDPRQEENTGPPPEDISVRRASSSEGTKAPPAEEKAENEEESGRFVGLNFESPPQNNVSVAEEESFKPRPAPQSLFGEEGWDPPESFGTWQEDEDDEVSRIEIKGDESFSALRQEGLELAKGKRPKSGRRKKGMQAISRKEKSGHEEEEIATASGDLLLRRVGAGAVDVAIWCLLGGLLYGGTHLLAGPVGTGGEWNFMALFPVIIMSLVLALVYGSLFSSMIGRTPGMMVCGVRMEDEHGKRPGLPQAFGRTALYMACLVPLGLGFLTMFAGGPDKSWFEKATGTRVVKA